MSNIRYLLLILIGLPFLLLLTICLMESLNTTELESSYTSEKCIEVKKSQIWCAKHSRQEIIWFITGKPYLITNSMAGYPEIVGLYSRTHPKPW